MYLYRYLYLLTEGHVLPSGVGQWIKKEYLQRVSLVSDTNDIRPHQNCAIISPQDHGVQGPETAVVHDQADLQDRHPFNGLFSWTTWLNRHQKG